MEFSNMKKIINVLTATRAEYGLLKPIIEKLLAVENFDVKLIVTGTHLSKKHGYTYQEIVEDGFAIDATIDILEDYVTSSLDVSKIMGTTIIRFAEYFSRNKSDLLLVLGDRYETLAVCCAAMNEKIPIAHMYGGETTEGAIDEAIRHSITKLSYLHFTSTEEYRKRVIQLGESPNRVFCVGAIGIENIHNIKLMSKEELETDLHFRLDVPYAMLTFHPVTLEEGTEKEQIIELLKAIDNNKHIKFIITKANADAGGEYMNQMIDEYVMQNDHTIAFASLGTKRYLSGIKYCSFIMGNSSSGLIEAPSFGIPTINIGDRQRGRLKSDSVIDCEANENSISVAIQKAMSREYQILAKTCVNPYGDGKTSEKVVSCIQTFLASNEIDLKKKFYDIEVNV